MPDLNAVIASAEAELKGIVGESMSELIDLPKVRPFTDSIVAIYAREKVLSLNDATPEGREEHKRNLAHLVAQVRGQATELSIQENYAIKEKIGRILETVGRTLLRIGPGLLAASA